MRQFGNLFRVACQGPDIFYHNQRTKPSGLTYGSLIHRKRYGKLVLNLIKEACSHPHSFPPELRAYVLGFITHAFLDRKTHPYIMYFSGWVNSMGKSSKRFFRCHAYLERILDVLILKEKRGILLQDYDFLSHILCETFSRSVINTFTQALHVTYPNSILKSENRTRIRNAHTDTMFFYKITNHKRPENLYRAYEQDRIENFRKRRIALFHPLELPAHIDFLNLERKMWCHPCFESEQYSLSFTDLYNQALQEVVPVIRAVDRMIAEKTLPPDLDEKIGNQSLDTNKNSDNPCIPKFSSPFPLSELLEDTYQQLSNSLT